MITAATEQSAEAAIAHGIRDRVSVLANTLAVLRLGTGLGRDEVLRMAQRQLDALAQLADMLHDPVRCD